MKIKRILWLCLGCIGLALGALGAVLPLLPTVPFLLLAALGFAKSSERLHTWFTGTKLYKNNLESYVRGEGMTAAAKRAHHAHRYGAHGRRLRADDAKGALYPVHHSRLRLGRACDLFCFRRENLPKRSNTEGRERHIKNLRITGQTGYTEIFYGMDILRRAGTDHLPNVSTHARTA